MPATPDKSLLLWVLRIVGGATGVGTENIHFPSARTKHNTDGLAHSGSSEMAPFEDSRQAPVCFPK